MLQITEESESRLILKDRRRFVASLAGCFTLMSIISVSLVAIQGIQVLIIERERDFLPLRLMTLGIFLIVGCGFVALGIFAMLNLGRGMVCVFDKASGVMTIQKMGVFRRKDITHSIYGFSHFEVETNEDVRAYGVFLMLRSGERIPLTAYSMLDRQHMESVLDRVRQFLHR